MSHEHRVEAALFRHLIDNSTIPLVASAAGSMLVTLAYSQTAYSRLAFAWLALVFATLGIRFWLARRYRMQLTAQGFNRSAAVRYAFSTSLSGLAWGIGGLLIMKASPLAMVITITAIQAMVMGAALTLASFMIAFHAFAFPAMLPMILILAVSGGTANIALALYSTIFLVLIINVAYRFNNSLRQTWELTFEKEDLVKALTEARDRQTELAKTDGLTRIANRRRFDDVLETEFARLQRSGAPLSLIILDVDHFKAFNDTYGHIAGDQCLKQVADVFQKNIGRASDLAARYGGEEFAGILPETEHAGAVSLAELIRNEVAALNISHSSSPTADHVTVSLGAVTVNCPETAAPTEVVALADQQLYLAKSAGRNRVSSFNFVKTETPP